MRPIAVRRLFSDHVHTRQSATRVRKITKADNDKYLRCFSNSRTGDSGNDIEQNSSLSSSSSIPSDRQSELEQPASRPVIEPDSPPPPSLLKTSKSSSPSPPSPVESPLHRSPKRFDHDHETTITNRSPVSSLVDQVGALWYERSGTAEILQLKESVNEASVAFDQASTDVQNARRHLDESLKVWERTSGQQTAKQTAATPPFPWQMPWNGIDDTLLPKN